MTWGFQNEHEALQKRIYRNARNANCDCTDSHRSASKNDQAALGLIMEVVRSAKSNRFTAFQATGFSYAHWDAAKEQMVSVEHRGYVCDAESMEEATAQLISMVRPMHHALGERMLDSVKNFGAKAR